MASSRRGQRRRVGLDRPELVKAGREPGAPKESSRKAATFEVVSHATAADQPVVYWLVAAAVSTFLLFTIFGRTIAMLVKAWDTEQDYSHGFVVAPLAAALLWMRRGSLPHDSIVPGWGGLGLLAASFGMAYLGERLFLAPVAGWAMVAWITGACWLIAGRRAMVWALPSLVFLLFMVPLPYRIEQLLSWRLQSVATTVSAAMLEFLGLAAIPEGHTIYLGDHVLEIEQACSGLRMCFGIAAVAFVFVVLHRRPMWERAVLILAVAPVAILSNAVRIVVTGLLMQKVSGEAAVRFSHDVAGWAMIAVAALLFGLLVVYLRKLVVDVEYETGTGHFSRSSTVQPVS
jgi:exosortase